MVCDNSQDLDLKHMMEVYHYFKTNMLGVLTKGQQTNCCFYVWLPLILRLDEFIYRLSWTKSLIDLFLSFSNLEGKVFCWSLL